MNGVKSIVAGAIFAALIAGGAFTAELKAQNERGEIFAVPFTFTVDRHEIEPGTYEVRRYMNQYLMSIQNVQTGEKQLFSVRPEERSSVSVNGLLVFHRCGDRRDLSEFHIRGISLYSTTIAPAHQRSVKLESCSISGTTTVAAR